MSVSYNCGIDITVQAKRIRENLSVPLSSGAYLRVLSLSLSSRGYNSDALLQSPLPLVSFIISVSVCLQSAADTFAYIDNQSGGERETAGCTSQEHIVWNQTSWV